MSDETPDRVTSWVGKSLVERMDEHVDWRYESRSVWVREAIVFRLALQAALERRDIDLPEDDEEREAFVEDIATAGVATFAAEDD